MWEFLPVNLRLQKETGVLWIGLDSLSQKGVLRQSEREYSESRKTRNCGDKNNNRWDSCTDRWTVVSYGKFCRTPTNCFERLLLYPQSRDEYFPVLFRSFWSKFDSVPRLPPLRRKPTFPNVLNLPLNSLVLYEDDLGRVEGMAWRSSDRRKEVISYD